MKKFIKKTVLFSLIPISFLLIIPIIADGTTDEFYLRFTSPKQSSLIIGTSRAAQGIIPSVVDSILECKYNFYNYAFTIAHSPFGDAYFESIKKKLADTHDGMFIVAVDPWSISSKIEQSKNKEQFDENKLCVGEMQFVNLYPNYFYFLESYSEPLIKIFTNKFSHRELLHKNGWLEIDVSMDSVNVDKRTNKKILEYKKKTKREMFSSARFDYLEKTISFLKEHGEVYLVRIPINKRIWEIEYNYMPTFDSLIRDLAKRKSVPYFEMPARNDTLMFTDGNHLYRKSAFHYSADLANHIKQYRNIISNMNIQ